MPKGALSGGSLISHMGYAGRGCSWSCGAGRHPVTNEPVSRARVCSRSCGLGRHPVTNEPVSRARVRSLSCGHRERARVQTSGRYLPRRVVDRPDGVRIGTCVRKSPCPGCSFLPEERWATEKISEMEGKLGGPSSQTYMGSPSSESSLSFCLT